MDGDASVSGAGAFVGADELTPLSNSAAKVARLLRRLALAVERGEMTMELDTAHPAPPLTR